MSKLTVRLCDMGCRENLVPVAEALAHQGVEVAVYCDPGSIAAEKYDSNLPLTDHIAPGVTVLTCLPLGTGYETIAKQGNPTILVQENPDWSDARCKTWFELPNVKHICVLQKGPAHDERAIVTGLPAIDEAAEQIHQVDSTDLCKRLELEGQSIVSVSLPGDVQGCRRMLSQLEQALTGEAVIVRSHPKLRRDHPFGFLSISKAVTELPALCLDLQTANTMVTAFEAMALAQGRSNFFITTHDSTMAWQAAVGGVSNVFVLPPTEHAEEWAKTAPIITSKLGEPFTGKFFPRNANRSLLIGDAVDNIVNVIREVT